MIKRHEDKCATKATADSGGSKGMPIRAALVDRQPESVPALARI